MATEEESRALAWLHSSPDVVSGAIPRQIQKMRTQRLEFAGLSGGKIHSVNWNFIAPTGNLAIISLVHPNFLIPGHDKPENQSATLTVAVEGLRPRSLEISARIGGVSLNELGVDLKGDVELLTEPAEAGVRQWLNSADSNQQGCMNVVAYSPE